MSPIKPAPICDVGSEPPAAAFPLSLPPRRSREPFELLAIGACPLPFAAEILSARAELSRKYRSRQS